MKANKMVARYKPAFISLLFLLLILNANAQSDSTNGSGNIDSSEYKVFERVEIEAKFPGGDDAWIKYLQRTLHAATPIDFGAPAGTYTVVVQFVVDKNGNISDAKALTRHGYGMEQEVLRVIRNGPKWIPAFQDGRNVKAYRKQPVTFVVQDGKKRKKNKD